MPRAHLARVLGVVVEVPIRQEPVLVAHQPIRLDPGRIELDLDLDVLGHGQERGAQFLDEHLLGLEDVVDVGVVAVPLVGQLLHLGVLEVAGAEAEHGQEDAVATALLDQPDQFALARDADVEVAVAGQDDPVVALLLEVLPRHLIGQLDPGAARGGAARLEPLEGVEDLVLPAAGRRRQHQTGRPGVHHDGHPILRPQLVDEQPEGRLDQRQLVG